MVDCRLRILVFLLGLNLPFLGFRPSFSLAPPWVYLFSSLHEREREREREETKSWFGFGFGRLGSGHEFLNQIQGLWDRGLHEGWRATAGKVWMLEFQVSSCLGSFTFCILGFRLWGSTTM